MRLTAVVALFPDLPAPELAAWVARGWVRPAGSVPYSGSPESGSSQSGNFQNDSQQNSGPSSGGSPDGSHTNPTDEWVFQEIDVARVRLIRDLRRAMAVQEETIPLVLSLLDQVYALRGQMRAMARAVETQDTTVRNAILDALRDA